jgi:hypothetical protein
VLVQLPRELLAPIRWIDWREYRANGSHGVEHNDVLDAIEGKERHHVTGRHSGVLELPRALLDVRWKLTKSDRSIGRWLDQGGLVPQTFGMPKRMCSDRDARDVDVWIWAMKNHRRPPALPRESPDVLRWTVASGCADFSVASA